MTLTETAVPYTSYVAYLEDLLGWLDLLLRRGLQQMAQEGQSRLAAGFAADSFISRQEVAWLLEHGANGHSASDLDDRLVALQDHIEARIDASFAQDIQFPLPVLTRLFKLNSFETQALIICLAPELRRKYDKIFMYLQDDVTRQRPSVDLILTLLCPTEADRWQMRPLFTDQAPLRRHGLLQHVEDLQSPSGSSGLAQFLALDPRILNFILGSNQPDACTNSYLRVLPATAVPTADLPEADQVLRLIEERDTHRPLYIYLQGRLGVGKHTLALAVAAQLDMPVLELDASLMFDQAAGQEDAVLRQALRESVLLQAVLFVDNLDGLQKGEGVCKKCLKRLTAVAQEYAWLVFLAGEQHPVTPDMIDEGQFHAFRLDLPDPTRQEAIWATALADHQIDAQPVWLTQLASRFRLTPGQIHAAANQAANLQIMKSQDQLTKDDLFAAARNHSTPILNTLAVKIPPRYTWADIVLPQKTLTQLRNLCTQVAYQAQVFAEWAFASKFVYGIGVSALFYGTSGTGKTMAAQVIAVELGLDLYKIDLSAVVSKYIGETEKNLSQIFREAELSNAILFFDEADALFGKRTGIKDAHDRYANIETSYLLQKMEEYEGVVILASNLRENMDDAFLRRLRFMIEFPFPDAEHRAKIWQAHAPSAAPFDPELDWEKLGDRFAIAGGSIKNIMLNAAFLAAAAGESISTAQILRSVQEEYEKMGKIWEAGSFADWNGET